MPANTQISISPISNGYVVADATAGMYGGSEWRFDASVFYPSLEALAADMPRFVTAAIERAEEQQRRIEERIAAEEAEFGGRASNPVRPAAGQRATRLDRMPGF